MTPNNDTTGSEPKKAGKREMRDDTSVCVLPPWSEVLGKINNGCRPSVTIHGKCQCEIKKETNQQCTNFKGSAKRVQQ